MNVAKKIILVLVSLIIIIYGLVFMSFDGIKNTLLNEEYYQTVVNDNNIPKVAHDALRDAIPGIVLEGITEGETITDPIKKAVVDEQVELFSTAIIDAIDEDWIGEQVVLVTDDIVQGLTGDTATLNAVINLNPKIDEIKANIAEGLQQYSDAELMAMFGAPKAFIPIIADQIVAGLDLPESLIINDIVSEMAPGTIAQVNDYLSTADTLFSTIILIIVLVVFLLLCILLVTRNIGIIWFGATLLISGILFRLSSSIILSFFSVENLIESSTQSIPISSELIMNIINYTTTEMGKSSIMFLLLGILFLVGGIILSRLNKE